MRSAIWLVERKEIQISSHCCFPSPNLEGSLYAAAGCERTSIRAERARTLSATVFGSVLFLAIHSFSGSDAVAAPLNVAFYWRFFLAIKSAI